MATNGLTYFLCLAGTVFVTSASGCGETAPSDAIPPPAHGYQLKTPALRMEPGTEKYLCYTVNLSEAAGVAITNFQAFTSPVVHHYELFQALAPEKEGVWDCTQQQIKMTWLPLFGGGAGAAGLTVPDGAGFKIPGDSQLLLQMHLVNSSLEPWESNIVVNMTYADDATRITPAGIFALGTMGIDLPAGATGVRLGSQCALPKQLNVFAVQPHMHKLGRKITFERGSGPAALQEIYKRDPWEFGEQPIDSFPMTLPAGEYVGTTCTFDNPGTRPVSYGESTMDEMCYFVLFYTPFDRLGGCIDG